MARGDLTDQAWAIIGPLLPSERGRWARPSENDRRFLNGMPHILRTRCPWGDMHERYGKWNPVYVRFRRWAKQGVWDALPQNLVDLGLADDSQHMLDSTVVRAHSQATGTKRGGSFGGFRSVTRRLYEQNPRPIRQSGTSSWLCPHRRTGLGL
ncbi:IS5 family transposase (plasmid) [Gluconobacter thailandicus]|uniref:IS5 family transposase n=1 Tax=Gluconobacter thailandicus TaxID=257438 RepID=A0AAP9JJV9_GLUTH|nr:IS5 family transposase [Gluconobacter thailandicus]QEH97774.1 IS5 family transposase [Gluconobacter thailandicus]